ncbi:unnamed protein product [Cuscuta epithymum]|uniref:Uncharacterized protein n=1 Tax=Cuscuta epithymum TaxID=186058 RepID=A0AAV0DUF3_9ASTE|nr:unnamed protein product [Cuscuta epithymum]
MPQTWRILRSLEFLMEKETLSYSVDDLGFTYDLRNSGKGRFILTAKTGMEPLILGVDGANDRGWLSKFFYVERSSLGEVGDLLPDRLRTTGETKTFSLDFGPRAAERTNAVLALDSEVRLFSNLKKELQGMNANSCPISPIHDGLRRSVRNMSKMISSCQDTTIISVDSSEKEEDTMSETGNANAHTFPEYCVSVPKPVIAPKVPSCIAATSSSSGMRRPLNPLDLSSLTSKRWKMAPPLPPSGSSASLVTRSIPSAPILSKPASLSLEFSSYFCRLDNALRMKDEISQMLLPSASSTFAGFDNIEILIASSALAFQVIQANLAAAQRIRPLAEELTSSKQREKEAKKKTSDLAQEKFAIEEKMQVQARLINNLQVDLRTRDARIKGLEEYGRRKRQEVVDAAAYYAWQTKKDIMKSYLAGEADKWTPEEDINA